MSPFPSPPSTPPRHRYAPYTVAQKTARLANGLDKELREGSALLMPSNPTRSPFSDVSEIALPPSPSLTISLHPQTSPEPSLLLSHEPALSQQCCGVNQSTLPCWWVPKPNSEETLRDIFEDHMDTCHWPPNYRQVANILRTRVGDRTPLAFSSCVDPAPNKPTDTAKLLQLVIFDSPGHTSSLQEIYERLRMQFGWYRDATCDWEGEIRNLLSKRKEFQKAGEHGCWTINFAHGEGEIAARRKSASSRKAEDDVPTPKIKTKTKTKSKPKPEPTVPKGTKSKKKNGTSHKAKRGGVQKHKQSKKSLRPTLHYMNLPGDAFLSSAKPGVGGSRLPPLIYPESGSGWLPGIGALLDIRGMRSALCTPNNRLESETEHHSQLR